MGDQSRARTVLRAALLSAVIAVVLQACGTTSPTARTSASDGIPDGPTSSSHWIADALPASYQLVMAKDGPASAPASSTGYRRNVHSDPFDAELQVLSMPPGSSAGIDVQGGTATTVRGHPASLVTLTDEGDAYGVGLSWNERPDLQIVVRASKPLTEADARTVAEHVRPVSDDDWHKLTIATDPVAVNDGVVTPDMQRVAASSGSVGGDPWNLTALLPAGYPLLAVDRRAACFELAFRAETNNGYSCVGHPNFVRIGGQAFAVGEVPSDVNRIRVTPDSGPPMEVETAAVTPWTDTRFWATPLPDTTCQLDIEPATGTSAGAAFGRTGPLDEPGTHDDWLRCLSSATPPTTPSGISPSPAAPPATFVPN